MQAEIDTLGWPTPVDLMGVNGAGLEGGNHLVVSGRVIPWLQDTYLENVWAKWKVTYRDVVILDGDNVPVAIFNLTVNDLSNPENYAALKTLLRQAAEPGKSR